MAIPNSAYDIMIDGNGYLLARNVAGEGPRSWEEQALIGSTAKRTPTEAQYGSLPSTVEAPMVWESWHSGYGDRVQRGEGRYHYCDNMDARVPDQILPGPQVSAVYTSNNSNVVKLIEYGDKVLALGGSFCKAIDSDGLVTMDYDFGANTTIVDACVFDGYLYVSFGMSMFDPFIWRRSWYGEWQQSTDVRCGYMTVWKDRLWAQRYTTLDSVTTTNGVQSCAYHPLEDTNWTTNGPIVGDPGSPITSMGSLGDMLYVGKADGLHGVDASNIAPCLTPEMKAYWNYDNCRGMIAWHGIWFVPHMRGLLTYRDTGETGFIVSDASPGRETDDTNPVRGIITAMAGDDHWLYAALYNSITGDSYILAGRPAVGSEMANGNMVWHPLATIADSRADAMLISGIWTNPRLFWGDDGDVNYIVLPREGDNPAADSNCRYATAGSLYLPAHLWDAPATTKVWKAIRIEAKGLSTARYFDVWFSIDYERWRRLGRVNVSPYHMLTFGQEGVSGSNIRLRIDYGGTTDTPFVIRSVVVVGAERPNVVRQYSAAIRCADKLALRNGGKCPRSAEQIRQELYGASQASRAVSLVDPAGHESYVLVQPEIRMQEAADQGVMNRELTMLVTMTDFAAVETPALQSEYATYGISVYDQGEVYQ